MMTQNNHKVVGGFFFQRRVEIHKDGGGYVKPDLPLPGGAAAKL